MPSPKAPGILCTKTSCITTCKLKAAFDEDLDNQIKDSVKTFHGLGHIKEGPPNDRDFYIAEWIDQGNEVKTAYQACMRSCPTWRDLYASLVPAHTVIKNGFLYAKNKDKE